MTSAIKMVPAILAKYTKPEYAITELKEKLEYRLRILITVTYGGEAFKHHFEILKEIKKALDKIDTP